MPLYSRYISFSLRDVTCRKAIPQRREHLAPFTLNRTFFEEEANSDHPLHIIAMLSPDAIDWQLKSPSLFSGIPTTV